MDLSGWVFYRHGAPDGACAPQGGATTNRAKTKTEGFDRGPGLPTRPRQAAGQNRLRSNLDTRQTGNHDGPMEARDVLDLCLLQESLSYLHCLHCSA
jgi:hypothetical protein